MKVFSKVFEFVKRFNFKKGIEVFKVYGFREGWNRASNKLKKIIKYSTQTQTKIYKDWLENNRASDKDLSEQSQIKFKYSPLISIVVPTYNTPIRYFKEMIDSVTKQSYSNWELCIADGSDDEKLRLYINKFLSTESRINYQKLTKNNGIANNTNEAIKLANGDYIAFLDHDDIIEPNALFEIVKELQNKKHDLIYTDEDFVTENLKKYVNPFFKPDWSPYLLRSHNYITHFLVIKKSVIDQVGFLNEKYDGAQDYDYILRCCEKSSSIYHIPKILYHWRMAKTSVAGNSKSKLYAYEAGRAAIQDHLKRLNISANVEALEFLGYNHVSYKVKGEPLVSIIIPNKDHVEYLDNCIKSIKDNSSYKNFEIIIVENNSVDNATFEYYKLLKKQFNNIEVIKFDGSFNYSAINNFAVKHSKGEYLLFLNNDTKLINPDSISEMLGLCCQYDVGAVGAKLLYEDNTIQHAGVVVGYDGSAVHPFHGFPKDTKFYKMRPQIICDYSSVTGACLMTKKALFNEVKGFDDFFAVAFNDVDFCLKLRDKGKSIVYTPSSSWYHYESKSRGYEDTPEKIKRFNYEAEMLRTKWPNYYSHCDPFYNINFSNDYEAFKIKKDLDSILYNIDSTRVFKDGDKKYAQIRGWALDNNNDISYSIYQNNQIVDFQNKISSRPDLLDINLSHDRFNKAGFLITFEVKGKQKYRFVISSGNKKICLKYSLHNLESDSKIKNLDSYYEKWLKSHQPSKAELNEQLSVKFEVNPKFSFVIPIFNTPKKYLKKLIKSIKSQTYRNWEICMSDGSGQSSNVSKYLAKLSKLDNVKLSISDKPLSISDNTNNALSLVTGDYVAFVDHDDLIEPNALFEYTKLINSYNNVDIIYSDEDKVDFKGKHYFDPHFKPDYNLDLLRSVNYICHLLVVRTAFQKKVGDFDATFDGAQDHDFILRCCEQSHNIFHIPKVLYHWRTHMNSTAQTGENKDYTKVSGRNALLSHYRRCNIDAAVTIDDNGYYKTNYPLNNNPLVSVIICNKDHKSDLEKCISSIFLNNSYKNIEIIIVENNSEEKKTFDYYDSLLKNHSNIKIVCCKQDSFNYSQLNNFGVSKASGDYLLFLNNDTEFINKDSIKEMLSICQRDDVGIVGAKLLYPDNRVQHAGVILGIQGVAGHQFVNYNVYDTGYFGRASVVQDLSAVTAACMMVKRTVFDKIKGFSSSFAVAFNDIDFCLKVRELDHLIVYTPHALLYHYESKSRGDDNTPENYPRFKNEVNKFKKKWGNLLEKGDPYYNLNLTLEKSDYSLKI